MRKIKVFLVIALVMTWPWPGRRWPNPAPAAVWDAAWAPAVQPPDRHHGHGPVEKLEDLPSMGRGGGKGMQYRGVLLKTDQGSLMVDLGPGWYLDEKKLRFKAGDTV